ncbi:hypothetical protein K474DRAFT_1578887, partial [Panus rudis PR-1116 ss-1]
LPVELWLEIFRWATLSQHSHYLHTSRYEPFEVPTPTSREEADPHLARELSVKARLALVCKTWRTLTLSLLYEDLNVALGTSRGLRHTLSCSEDTLRYFVRRVSIPYSSSITPDFKASAVSEVTDILRNSPLLETLERPPPRPTEMLSYEFPAPDLPPLPTLKRLDFWHHNEASRSGGINSLPDVLRATPNLQYLTVGGSIWVSFLSRPETIELPQLTTLRIRRMNALFSNFICKWHMPSLRTLIYDTAVALDALQDKFGTQIKTVELGMDLKFATTDTIHRILHCCPNLEELYYYPLFTITPEPLGEPHQSLRVIGLHSQPPGFWPPGTDEYWLNMRDHILSYTAEAFPALTKLMLYGDW